VLGEPSRKYFGMIEDSEASMGNAVPPEDGAPAGTQEVPGRDSDDSK
jgi:hypothetical protein